MSRNALWLPNLVSRTPDQSVVHCWVKGHVGVIWGQPGVKLLRNALWPPNLVGRIPDQSVMHCWGQRSCRGQLGSSRVNLLAMPYDHQIWWEEPLSRVKCIAGVKGHVEFIWGQVGVNLLSNALRQPNLVGRTLIRV